MKHKLSSFLIGDLILFAALLLAPPLSGIFRIVQTVLLLLSGLAALWLIVQISRQKETISGVLLLKLEPDDQFNPSQYLSRGGTPCAGSDGKYKATFQFPDQTEQAFSLSCRQAAMLSPGMRGTLCFREHVYLSCIGVQK